MTDDVFGRFVDKILIGDGCWEWQGARSGNGYGTLGVDGRTRLAHRLSYQHFIGPIPDGLDLDHLCRVRWCVNPRHLEPVTRSVNATRGETGRVARATCSICGDLLPPLGDPQRRDGTHRGCFNQRARGRRDPIAERQRYRAWVDVNPERARTLARERMRRHRARKKGGSNGTT